MSLLEFNSERSVTSVVWISRGEMIFPPWSSVSLSLSLASLGSQRNFNFFPFSLLSQALISVKGSSEDFHFGSGSFSPLEDCSVPG